MILTSRFALPVFGVLALASRLMLAVEVLPPVQAVERPVSVTLPAETSAPVSDTTEDKKGSPSKKWSGKNLSFYFGFSPLFKPKIAGTDRLNIGNLTCLDAGVELKDLSRFGLFYSRGTVPSLQVYNPLTFTTTNYPKATLSVLGIYGGVHVPLNGPYEGLGPLQLFVPLHLGIALSSLSAPGASFQALSVDSAAGLGARLYTWSFVRLDLSALYHFGLPVTSFSAATINKVQAGTGEELKSSTTGFEFRMGLAFIFPDSADGKANQ